MADLYLWLKALHVAAAFTFFAGLLGTTVFLLAPGSDSDATVIAMRRWDQRVTTPAMLLIWGFGLALALTGGWFRAGWLIVKLALVIALSGLHAVQSAKLRRMAGGRSVAVPPRFAGTAAVLSIVTIALLAILKPS